MGMLILAMPIYGIFVFAVVKEFIDAGRRMWSKDKTGAEILFGFGAAIGIGYLAFCWSLVAPLLD